MATHKAYLQKGPNALLTVQTVHTPLPSGGQVRVTVLATPILSYTPAVLSGDLFPLAYPLTPGVAAIGRISAVGEDSTALRDGQLVYCSPCIRARDDHSGGTFILQGWFGGLTAEAMKLMQGPWRQGSWAEQMVVPIENVVPLDEHRLVTELGYSVPQLCWMNEYLVPFGGFLAAGFAVGMTVIVAPATGHFGGCAVRLGLAMGGRQVVAVGRNAAALGTVARIDPNGRVKSVALSGDVEADGKAIRDVSPGGRGADIYIDFSPFQAGKATHPQACISALKPGGTLVLMGGVRENISLNYAQLMINNITVRGNFMYATDVPARFRDILESGILSLGELNTTVFSFEGLVEGIQFAEKHVGMADLTVMTPVAEQ